MVRPDYVKIALVGDGTVGKTSLLNAFGSYLIYRNRYQTTEITDSFDSSSTLSSTQTEGLNVKVIDLLDCPVLTYGRLV